ncbi:hypothetical protein PR202_ga07034 [Eleusine coracana subsp. coracana]|uniref:Uncharacterized protein n=1 Tax=Eleusine coracana subsp. coracana TaxID=191504 RepID=A0AAV5BXN3_ELECO|nr:hypothetical protein QOZ80_2AG0107640 [Eleusine coracana subsp. coracana]GJM90727.1 hypothetical protein PR202_ga07034 [Eleusine coracana subsp. coracana]
MDERYYNVDLDQATGLSEVDDDETLLMELLEDLQPSDLADGDVDRLSHVIRSLEAEIGGDTAAAAVTVLDDARTAGPSCEDDGSMLLEEMLLDHGGYESESFGYWPIEARMVGHAAEGWYLYAGDECEGSMIGFEAMDHQYHYVESSGDEQVYSPLWG